MASKIPTNNKFLMNETFPNFGKYSLKDDILLNLPGNLLKISDLGDGKFSFTRNSQNETIQKIIQINPNIHQIELAPVLPIHIPKYKTDFFFIRFDEPIFIAENSSIEISIFIPVEVGLFVVSQNKSSGIDFFSCDTLKSHFGLYGTPEDGKLCKYSTTSIIRNQIEPKPFTFAQFNIKIINELDESATVRKIVFPITDHDLYYQNNEVKMDGLRAIIKNRMGLQIIETIQEPISKSSNWNMALRDTKKTDYKFSMEWGFD